MYLCERIKLTRIKYNSMKRTFAPYVVLYFLVVFIMAVALYVYPKGELHLLLNGYHCPLLDEFFSDYTILAEFPLYILAAFPLLFWKAGWTYIFALSEGFNAILVCITKHWFQQLRPVAFFEHTNVMLPLVKGVHMHRHNSFPSGHTSTFFVFFTVAALLLAWWYARKSPTKHTVKCFSLIVCIFILPLIGGYSRIYLSQHFLSDVFVGSLFGFFTPCLVFWWFDRQRWLERHWFNDSIFARMRGTYFFNHQ